MKFYPLHCAVLLALLLSTVSGLQSNQCGVDLHQLAIDMQDVSTVILEGTAIVIYTVFQRELGPPPPQLGIVIPPPRNVSFKSPDSMLIMPSTSTFYSASAARLSTFHFSSGPKSSPGPTVIADVRALILEFIYRPECSINPGESSRVSRNRHVSAADPALNIILFETLSKVLNVTISKVQYDEFSSTIVEIAEEYIRVCKASTHTNATIYTLYDQLVEVRDSNTSKKANVLRSILAKTLCSHTRTKRQSSGTNPNMNDFFALITPFEARDIFGFNFNSINHNLGLFPSLTFVVDTTASMSNAIADVKEAIKSIIALEQQNPYFYVLTPFNDYDGDPDPSYSELPSKPCLSLNCIHFNIL
jgi:hypothetical protein